MKQEELLEENVDEKQLAQAGGANLWKRICFLKDDTSGAGVIEVVLILVVLIALVILFKEQIMDLADLIFGDMFTKAESVF